LICAERSANADFTEGAFTESEFSSALDVGVLISVFLPTSFPRVIPNLHDFPARLMIGLPPMGTHHPDAF
jgi:hypothetical protein